MRGLKVALLASAIVVPGAGNVALAQDVGATDAGLDVIVVTAQKREQNLQDVPIAVTALGEEALEAQRVFTISELSGLAPGLTVVQSAGGQKTPNFVMRGANSSGTVPGADKQVSIYLDGVYISSSRGLVFDLPDVQRLEVLRGPQGTLFGRNATAGAVNIVTRDPTGEVGVKARATVGNYGQYRFSLGVDLPQMGPFSGYVSYIHNERRGDIRNTAAGQLWDRRNALVPSIAKIQRSPEYLGSENTDTWFAALKFESGDFKTVYKFDYARSVGTPRGTGFVGYNANVPLLGNLLTTLINTQPYEVPISADGRRPDAVANGFATPSPQRVQGHSLTSTYQISDNLSVKNIAAFRKSSIFSPTPIDGVSSLILTPEAIGPFATLIAFSTVPGLGQADPATQGQVIGQVAAGLTPLIGSPYVGIVSQAQGRSKQFSDELQLNYDSDLLTATVGAMWFHSKDWVSEHGFQNTLTFSPIAGGVLPNQNIGRNFNKATSLAAYAQLEFHLSPQIDVIAGGRITQDKKSGTFTFGADPADLQVIAFDYKKTKPNYLIGVNYKPNDDILLYGKFSTAYVSGGSVAGIEFEPETVRSFEAGIKAELLDRRLRANLAVFQATYKHSQGPSAPTSADAVDLIIRTTGNPDLPAFIGTFVAELGTTKAKGVEFDFTAVPVDGLTLGGSLGYTDTKFTDVNPAQIRADGTVPLLDTFRPDWAGSFYAQFDTPPIGSGDAYASFRFDGRWQSDVRFTRFPDDPQYQTFAAGVFGIPSYWVFNGRVSIRDLNLGGVNAELAAWGRNLTDNRSPNFGLDLGVMASANYIPARTYGMDLNIRF